MEDEECKGEDMHPAIIRLIENYQNEGERLLWRK